MNHCRDCNSDYSSPGTCNCFAVGGKRYARAYPYTPWYPWQTVPYPYYGPYWVSPTTTTITVGDTISGTTATYDGVGGGSCGPITSGFVSLENAMAFSAGCTYTAGPLS